MSGYLFEQGMQNTIMRSNFRQMVLILQPSVVRPVVSHLI